MNILSSSIFMENHPFMGQDPYVTKYKDQYYMAESVNESQIAVTLLTSIQRPKRFNSFIVWDDESEFQVWAPELHQIHGLWYIYYTASDGNNATHRTYVLGAAHSPFGPYHFKEQVGPDIWGIDMTTFKIHGQRYAAWSGWENNNEDFPQHLYLAKMISPVEIGERVKLSSPLLDWEKSVAPILEGPQFVGFHDQGLLPNDRPAHRFAYSGEYYLSYSANASWTQDYATGLLWLVDQRDPLNPDNWKKEPSPLATNVGHGCWIDGYHIYHRKMSAFPGWNDREIQSVRISDLLST